MKQINNIIRGSIWMCDMSIYKSKIKHLQNGLRPVLIISNDTCNINSPVIQVIPLTTKFKNNLLTHVILDKEYGLRQRSIALIEAITSIEIDCLKYKIGFIDEDKMVEIENNIKIQHGISNIFNIDYIINVINSIDNIESDKINHVTGIIYDKIINYIEKYKPEFNEYIRLNRHAVTKLFNNHKYNECLEEIKNMIRIIDILDNTYDKWFYNFRISMCYYRFNDYKNSIKYNKISMDYVDKESDDTKYPECLWMLGICYQNLGNIKESLRYYNKCIKFYTKFNMFENLTDVMLNKYSILKDYKGVHRALEIRLKYKFKTNEKILERYYEGLVECYINKDIFKAKEYFDKIKDTKLSNKTALVYIYKHKLIKSSKYSTYKNIKVRHNLNLKYKFFKLKSIKQLT